MTTWQIIKQALAHKKPMPRNQKWLADQLGVKEQVIANWQTRGVPAARIPELADPLGLTLNQLYGIDPLPWEQEMEWPFDDIPQERLLRLPPPKLALVQQRLIEVLNEQEGKSNSQNGKLDKKNIVTAKGSKKKTKVPPKTSEKIPHG